MKIQVIDGQTKKPLLNTKIQVQVKGKDSGFLTLTTDQTGYITLEDKFTGQQLIPTTGGTAGGKGVTATDGATLIVATVGAKQKETTGGRGK